MRELIEPHSDRWYQARSGKFTASCFGLIMTRPPRGVVAPLSRTAEKYIRRKAMELKYGRAIEDDKDYLQSVQWGYKYEEEALSVFRQRTELSVCEGGLAFHPKWPDVGATPDALIRDEPHGRLKATVQVKCPFKTHNHLKYREKVYDGPSLKRIKKEYYWQVLGEMWVFGLEEAYFISYDPRLPAGEDLHVVHILPDEGDLLDLATALLRAIQWRDQWAGL